MDEKIIDISEQETEDEEDLDSYDSDDSLEDPTFDVLEETGNSFSNLAIEKKPKYRIRRLEEETLDEDPGSLKESVVPELDHKDQKNYVIIQKTIEDGQVDKLKVEQCKVYLKKHGLRMTGNKATLIQRIKEHIEVINGGGEKKYPESSFVMNCKGDACTGDVVMFEQNVYDMFNIASRSATGPPCGKRTVAGRIVKESYGAAKQQHTFTIEVLWSRGETPLQPLHPLLIKGRNLYKLKTMRQRWVDEGERQKILSEKHVRGEEARSRRESRLRDKENRMMQKTLRKMQGENKKKEKGRHPHIHKDTVEDTSSYSDRKEQERKSKGEEVFLSGRERILENPEVVWERPQLDLHKTLPQRWCNQRKPLIEQDGNVVPPVLGESMYFHFQGVNPRHDLSGDTAYSSRDRRNYFDAPRHHPATKLSLTGDTAYSSLDRRNYFDAPRHHPVTQLNQKQGQPQLCRFYPQGRCYYGENCRYLHELRR